MFAVPTAPHIFFQLPHLLLAYPGLSDQRCNWHSWQDTTRQLPTPVFLPGEFRGQRSLAGNSPWGHRVRHFHFHFTLQRTSSEETVKELVHQTSPVLLEALCGVTGEGSDSEGSDG